MPNKQKKGDAKGSRGDRKAPWEYLTSKKSEINCIFAA